MSTLFATDGEPIGDRLPGVSQELANFAWAARMMFHRQRAEIDALKTDIMMLRSRLDQLERRKAAPRTRKPSVPAARLAIVG